MINRPMPKPKDFLPIPQNRGAHRPRTQHIPMPHPAARDGPMEFPATLDTANRRPTPKNRA